VASDRPCCSVDSSSQFILPSWLFIYYYFVSAAVAVDSSHMTASSSASWSRFSPLSNFVNGHMSVAYWHQTLEVSPGEDIRSEVEMLRLKSLYFGCANIIKLCKFHAAIINRNAPVTDDRLHWLHTTTSATYSDIKIQAHTLLTARMHTLA